MRKTAPNLLSLLQLISGLLAIFAIILISFLLLASAIGILGSPNSLRLLSITVASIFVIHSALSLWDFAPSEQQALAQRLWKARASWLFESRTLSVWPVVLVLLTSLLGVSEWFPTTGPDRPILLAAIGLVATYGFVREAREKQKNLLAFAHEAAKQTALERDKDAQRRKREAEVGRISRDIHNHYSREAAEKGCEIIHLLNENEVDRLTSWCTGAGLDQDEIKSIKLSLGIVEEC